MCRLIVRGFFARSGQRSKSLGTKLLWGIRDRRRSPEGPGRFIAMAFTRTGGRDWGYLLTWFWGRGPIPQWWLFWRRLVWRRSDRSRLTGIGSFVRSGGRLRSFVMRFGGVR